MNLIAHEDEHLLVAVKPPGWNTHAPAPFANEGLYEWLKNREPRWSRLAIIHRLDKETSGLIVFGKSPQANRSLTQQFESRGVAKKYAFLTDRAHARAHFTVKTKLSRVGDRYASGAAGQPAETRFSFVGEAGGAFLWEAEPLTGRTHQIRVHAAGEGIPILGDRLYGGAAAPRLCLHAAQLAFRHPVTNEPLEFRNAPDFSKAAGAQLRAAIIDPSLTDAYRLVHGAADGWPGLYVDRLGDFIMSAAEKPLNAEELVMVESLPCHAAYHKLLAGQPVNQTMALLRGEAAANRFAVRENGVRFELSFAEGGSVGLFLDQRENRRRLLTGCVAPEFALGPVREALNAFAYTCAFSVCAAMRGAKTASIDLSRKYLNWGRQNFSVNSLDSAEHEFLAGDAFHWFTRLARKKRAFDIVILDPPTFSRSKESGVFRAEKDYGKLIAAALPLVKPGGILFASTNAAGYPAESFLLDVEEATHAAGRRIERRHYSPQPPDFPIHAGEPAYLKTLWVKLAS